jgi:hypothetical protein
MSCAPTEVLVNPGEVSLASRQGAQTMGDESQPRAFVAHQQMLDLFLVALIAKHSDPQGVMRQFRELVDQLTAATPELVRDESFLAAVRRSATRFDGMVQRLLPATHLQHRLEMTSASAIDVTSRSEAQQGG